MECLICGGGAFRPYYYPPNLFNNKTFRYFECSNCHSAQIDPLPDENDIKLMYGSNDHSYLLHLKPGETHQYTQHYPKFNHQGLQLDFLKKYDYHRYGDRLLDVGCGSGFYMNYAKTLGFTCYGIEFSSDFARMLREKTGQEIYSFEEFDQQNTGGNTFDIIHIGHMLEHSTAPGSFLTSLKKYAHPNTVFVVDGPLEKNKCLSRFVIKCGSLLRRNKLNTYHPQHITFTNAGSQLLFFEKAGLQKINYEVTEQTFPLPNTFNVKKPLQSLLFIISRLSILISRLNPGWGNVFHYSGKLKGQP